MTDVDPCIQTLYHEWMNIVIFFVIFIINIKKNFLFTCGAFIVSALNEISKIVVRILAEHTLI